MTATPDPVQRQLADFEVRIVRLEHRDGPVPPFVSAAGALEAALLRFVPERAETGKLVRAINAVARQWTIRRLGATHRDGDEDIGYGDR